MSEQRWGIWVDNKRWWQTNGVPYSWSTKAEAELQADNDAPLFLTVEVRPCYWHPRTGPSSRQAYPGPEAKTQAPLESIAASRAEYQGAEAKPKLLPAKPTCCAQNEAGYACACRSWPNFAPGPRYTLAQLARALAETDPELVAVATRAAEGDPARLERCIAIAVDRDERMARTTAERRVEAARARLR